MHGVDARTIVQFVANVPSIWAAIIEASQSSPTLSECEPSTDAPHQQQQQQQQQLPGQGQLAEAAASVPFPSGGGPAGFLGGRELKTHCVCAYM